MATIFNELAQRLRPGFKEQAAVGGYTAERFVLSSATREAWEKAGGIASRIVQMQEEAWENPAQRHNIVELSRWLRVPETVGVLLRDEHGEVVGFSYTIPERRLDGYTPSPEGDRTAHHMMIVIDEKLQGQGLVKLLMQKQIDEVAKHGGYDFMHGEYNAFQGSLRGDRRVVHNGFAHSVINTKWANATIKDHHPIGNIGSIYGVQESITFDLRPTA